MADVAALLPNAEQQFIDGNGQPYAGGSVYFYVPGSSTPKNTWQDPGATILNTNPIVLDASGRAIIYGEGDYRQVLFDSLGNEIWDRVTSSNQSSNSTPVPSGAIIIWSGAIGSIPSGFVLCDGTNGTPDLRDRFVVGAGNTYAVGVTGGAVSNTPVITSSATVTVAGHAITISEMPVHTHGVTDPTHGHNDSGHIHAQDNNTYYNAVGLQISSGSGINISASGANTAAGFAIIAPAATGISIQNQGGGATHTHTATSAVTSSSSVVPTLPPYYALAYIMKT